MARYAVFNFSAVKKIVLAIRGNQQLDDVLADVQMMAAVAALDTLSNVVPIKALIPMKAIQWYLKELNPAKWFSGRPAPYEPHLRKAMALIEQCEAEGCEVFVTGHSLGGVFAAIFGS